MRSVIIILNLFLTVSAFPAVIKIGGIFSDTEERLKIAFRYAVESINVDPRILKGSRIEPHIKVIPGDDSFKASNQACLLVREGVAAIFGPQTENSANHVQSICSTLNIPYVETRWQYKLFPDTYSINLYPHPASLTKAYFDVIKTLGWKKFVILYDTNNGLIKLQDILKSNLWEYHVRQLEEPDYRPMMKHLKKTAATKFIVDLEQNKINKFLKQALDMDLMTEYQSYFFTSLDMNIAELEEYRYSGTNITALRIVDPEKEGVKKVVESWSFGEQRFHRHFDPNLASITTEAALIYDAVHLFARALADLRFSSDGFEIPPMHCDVETKWDHGNSVINLMKWYSSHRYVNQTALYQSRTDQYMPYESSPMSGIGHYSSYQSPYNRSISFAPEKSLYNRNEYGFSGGINEVLIIGLSGHIKFDSEGLRTDFDIQITEFVAKLGKMAQVGVWSLHDGANYTRNYIEQAEQISDTLRNRTLVVVTAVNSPYTMLKEGWENLEGNDRYEGYCLDLIHNISKQLSFSYTIVRVKDDVYGNYDEETGEYTGMIGELVNHRADLAIVDLTITYEREEAVDFSMPFMDLGIGILFTKPQKKPHNLFSFMSPFAMDVWIYMATAYLGVSVLLFILARMSPAEWTNPYPCIDEPDEMENSFSLMNTMWFIIGTFLCQGADIAPRAVSTRIVASIWWFFTLIMISSYTANLAAFLTLDRMDSPITGADDLAKQSKIKYGCKKFGSTYAFFEQSSISSHKKMWNAMINSRQSVFMENNDKGVDRVEDQPNKYAFLMESSSIEYVVERRCDLQQVGGLLDAKSYGIALPQGSPYTGYITETVLKLKESGYLHNLKTKWWKKERIKTKCQTEVQKDASSAAELGLSNVGGMFVVLAFGGMCSVFIGCCEFIWKARKLAREEGESFSEELMKELKFVIQCNESTKPVKKPKSDKISSNYSSANNFDFNPSF